MVHSTPIQTGGGTTQSPGSGAVSASRTEPGRLLQWCEYTLYIPGLTIVYIATSASKESNGSAVLVLSVSTFR